MSEEHREGEDANTIEETYKEIIAYLELINRKFSRIRMLEERLENLEENLNIVISRMRRIEDLLRDYIGAYEEKSRGPVMPTRPKSYIEKPIIEKSKETVEEMKEKKIATPIKEEKTGEEIMDKINTLTETEKQIISILAKNPDIRGGTALARRIGKTREHVSRLLKKLADEGILVRDEKSWPYKYIVPDKIKQYIIVDSDVR
jgi:predicted transcriptional regulator|uniref:Helix-turn-helix domain-containing protein n=1 Tax=Thermodesulfobium narugense TaxID=184064 RepID=A0A7C5KER9_9BACT